MSQQSILEEDIALKKTAAMPAAQKPGFAWRDVMTSDDVDLDRVTLRQAGVDRSLELGEISEAIGSALTDLLLVRGSTEIFSHENKEFVSRVTQSVAHELLESRKSDTNLILSPSDVHVLIERALVRHQAYDVAKSLVIKRPLSGADREELSEDVERHPLRLIRRNGKVVPWNEAKIEVAVRKAFLSLRLDSDPAVSIAQSVTERLLTIGNAFVHLEDLQDLVQEELMRQGHYKVAEAYILYRAQRARNREESAASEADQAIDQQATLVMVRDQAGQNIFWDGSDLRKRIEFGMIGLELCLSFAEIEAELRRSVYPEMTVEDLRRTIILNSKTLIERDADFAKFAARILLSYIYEEVLDWDIHRDGIGLLKEAHVRAFRKNLERAVELGRLSPELLTTCHVEQLAGALDPSADLEFDYLGIQTLYDRYLLVDKSKPTHQRLETPQFFWMRVAMGLFLREETDREEWVLKLYHLYKSRRFCSSTPTLFNSGTLHSQLSSCYLYKVDDSIESIMQRGIADNAYLSKWAGGLGGSWTAVRGTGSYIQGTNGESQGVIPFLKLHNDQLVAVNQGGKRRGSGCAYLETWHNDILDFLELRKNTGDDRRRTHDMNTANWIPDLFMKRMENREDWTLFRANETPDLHELYGRAFEGRYAEYEEKARRGEIYSKVIPAIELWKAMLKTIFETGHPWITFKDPCNVRSPQDHAGVIHSSNLCTEITLNTSADETAVCNLGSVILETHLAHDGSLDHQALRDTIRVAIRALDNVIDINYYPTESARTSNERHRPIGLGVMGLQNALAQRGQSFASSEAVEFNDEFMEAIAHYAYEASSDLAAERGTYSSYKGSKWDRGILPQDTLDLLEQERGVPLQTPRGGRMDWAPVRQKIAKQGMRNSNVLAIAPTATISNIMGTSPCIEPNYKNLYVKSNLSGEFIVLNRYLVRDLKALGLWSQDMIDQLKYFDGELGDIREIPEEVKRRHLTVFSISFEHIIDAAARRQKWIDQSQSVNLFLAEPDLKTLSHMYRHAWRSGLKTTYYLRTLGASNIEKATVSVKKDVRGRAGETDAAACALEAMRSGEECEACQ